MQDEQTEQPDEAAEQTDDDATGGAEAEADAGAEAEADDDAGKSEAADAVAVQAGDSTGEAAEDAPEVPDDARETIARAQEHIDTLDMKEEAKAAETATQVSNDMAEGQ